MVTITVKIDDSCDMADVQDSEGNRMDGNFWDFHNGCHGLYHLPNFHGVESFVQTLKTLHESNGKEVQIIRECYSYPYK